MLIRPGKVQQCSLFPLQPWGGGGSLKEREEARSRWIRIPSLTPFGGDGRAQRTGERLHFSVPKQRITLAQDRTGWRGRNGRGASSSQTNGEPQGETSKPSPSHCNADESQTEKRRGSHLPGHRLGRGTRNPEQVGMA